MEKKQYVAPKASPITWAAESLMLVASPGVGGGYNPGEEIETRRQDPTEEDGGLHIWGDKKSLWEE